MTARRRRGGRRRGTRRPSRRARSRSRRRACSCRTSPACPRSSTSPRCATRCATSAAIPAKINPLLPAELVIDHSVQVDEFANRLAIQRNAELEFQRNRERYAFLRWGQTAFDELQGRAAEHRHRPPGQPRVPRAGGRGRATAQAFPDTLVGTDSHTTMINGLGVLGWGVGGIEAEAAMLGEAISMLVPQVVGFQLSGALPEGATATDLVLTVTQILRETGVVGKFVEYFGEGLERLPLADRATIGNMSPEYGATCGFFPVDDETLRYLRLTGRPTERIALVEAYCKENGLWHEPGEHADVLAGGRARPRDGRAVARRARGARRTGSPLRDAKQAFLEALPTLRRRLRQRPRRGRRRVVPRLRSARRASRPARRGAADAHVQVESATRRRRARRRAVRDRRRDVRARSRRRRDRRDHVAARTRRTRR